MEGEAWLGDSNPLGKKFGRFEVVSAFTSESLSLVLSRVTEIWRVKRTSQNLFIFPLVLFVLIPIVPVPDEFVPDLFPLIKLRRYWFPLD